MGVGKKPVDLRPGERPKKLQLPGDVHQPPELRFAHGKVPHAHRIAPFYAESNSWVTDPPPYLIFWIVVSRRSARGGSMTFKTSYCAKAWRLFSRRTQRHPSP